MREDVLGARVSLAFFLLVLCLTMSRELVGGETAPTLTRESSRMDRMSEALGEAYVVDKLSAEFSSFLGADARAVVAGLRNGTPIILTRAAASTTPGSSPTITKTNINPPAGKTGFGNVFIALSLAKQQLEQVGILQPTPAQLQAALLGGTISRGSGASSTSTNLHGILTMRSQNMGWGQIAHQAGFRLGPVVNGLRASNHRLAMGTASPKAGSTVHAGDQPIGSGGPVSSPSSITSGHERGFGVSGPGRAGAGHGKGLSK